MSRKRQQPGWALAVKKAGSQVAVGKALGIPRSKVWQYLHGELVCPVPRTLELEEKLDVPRWLTRPDLFPVPEGVR